jgi:DNA-binding transcriptional MerR regulator
MSRTARTYRIREFAALAGATVRALRHYDRLGLLKPRRTYTGYRVYSAEDLGALEQIVALKFIGLPLKKVKGLVRRSPSELAQALHAQRTVIEEKRNLLDRAIAPSVKLNWHCELDTPPTAPCSNESWRSLKCRTKATIGRNSMRAWCRERSSA